MTYRPLTGWVFDARLSEGKEAGGICLDLILTHGTVEGVGEAGSALEKEAGPAEKATRLERSWLQLEKSTALLEVPFGEDPSIFVLVNRVKITLGESADRTKE